MIIIKVKRKLCRRYDSINRLRLCENGRDGSRWRRREVTTTKTYIAAITRDNVGMVVEAGFPCTKSLPACQRQYVHAYRGEVAAVMAPARHGEKASKASE